MAPPSPQELVRLAEINPEVEAIVKSGNLNFNTDFSDPIAAIKQIRAFLETLPIPQPIADVKDTKTSYTTRDGTTLGLYVYRPTSIKGNLPLLVWFHGGGGCIGSPAMSPFCREIALTQRCVVVAPQYRLGPEFKFPVGTNDSWDALQHIAGHAGDEAFGADPSKGFILSGESNGAVTASVLTLLARDNQLSPPLSGVFLSCGSFIPPEDVPPKYRPFYLSRHDPTCLEAPGLNKEAKAAFDICLAGDYSSPMYRATLWPTGHAGLPKTYFQTCGMDINRDDSFIYKDILDENGCETKLDVYPGCTHCFWAVFTMIGEFKRWKQDTVRGIGWLLGN